MLESLRFGSFPDRSFCSGGFPLRCGENPAAGRGGAAFMREPGRPRAPAVFFATSRHGVVTAAAPGMAAGEPPQGEPAAFRGPYFRSASSAYCEQVGVKRHDGGVKGEMQSW